MMCITTVRHTLAYILHITYHIPHMPKIDIGPLHAINVCDVTRVLYRQNSVYTDMTCQAFDIPMLRTSLTLLIKYTRTIV
jgi:hypothetical protein